jgi:hypothetical protein
MSRCYTKALTTYERDSLNVCPECNTNEFLYVDKPTCASLWHVRCFCGITGPLKSNRQEALNAWDKVHR